MQLSWARRDAEGDVGSCEVASAAARLNAGHWQGRVDPQRGPLRPRGPPGLARTGHASAHAPLSCRYLLGGITWLWAVGFGHVSTPRPPRSLAFGPVFQLRLEGFLRSRALWSCSKVLEQVPADTRHRALYSRRRIPSSWPDDDLILSACGANTNDTSERAVLCSNPCVLRRRRLGCMQPVAQQRREAHSLSTCEPLFQPQGKRLQRNRLHLVKTSNRPVASGLILRTGLRASIPFMQRSCTSERSHRPHDRLSMVPAPGFCLRVSSLVDLSFAWRARACRRMSRSASWSTSR